MAIEQPSLPALPKLPQVWQPQHAEEAWTLKRRLGETACYVSGGTLLRTQWENEVRPIPAHLISLESIRELRGIRRTARGISIGALTTLAECGDDEQLGSAAPSLAQAVSHVAAPSVRNLATIGGQIAGLTGDSLPALLALDAELIVYRDGGWRSESLARWLRAEDSARRPDDLICRVVLRKETADASPGEPFRFYEKLGRREGFAPSLVTVAGCGRITDDGTVTGVRLASGGGSALPARLPEAEEALNGARLSAGMLELVHGLIRGHYDAAEDWFAGASYRKEASANMITARLWQLMKR